MNQREALVTIIDFVREQAPEDPRILRALKLIKKRADILRVRHEQRGQRRACARCSALTSGVLCWRCWHSIPEGLRGAVEGARTDEAKRAAIRAVFVYVKTEEAA